MINLLAILTGTAFYTYGELKNKWGKYLMGIPVGVVYALSYKSWTSLLCMVTYFIACQIGYGDNNPLTKLVGKRWAITIHGMAVGIASAVIVQWWGIVGGLMAGLGFYVIAVLDDKGYIKEPYVAIFRGLIGTSILLLK